MKYLAQYIKKLCPDVVVTKSKTTESEYYEMGHNFIVRLSKHIGWSEKGKISIVKSFNTDDFIVMVESSPFPLIKTRKEVRLIIKTTYELSVLNALSKDYHSAKQKAELESLTDWEKFWSKICQLTPNARYLNNAQKDIIKEYFGKGIIGELMVNSVKKIKPTTSVTTIPLLFDKMLKTIKEDKKETK